jgi:hypothetical protein
MGGTSTQNPIMQMLSMLTGSAPTNQPPSAQPPSMGMTGGSAQASPMMGGSQQSNPPAQAQTLSGGPTFAPDADGNLQIVPAGVQGAAAYMNQPPPMTQQQSQQSLMNAWSQPMPPAPSQATMQTMMQSPQFMNAIAQALGGTYGGGGGTP